jgi:aromatic ring-cleaving dioxygenase
MTAREVSEQLGFREFLALCAAVDKSQGPHTKFMVAKVRRDSECGLIHCLVVYADALVDRVDIPILSVKTKLQGCAA